MVLGPPSRAWVRHRTKTVPNYNLDMELAAHTRDTVVAWRSQIASACELSSGGSLDRVLARPDLTHPYVVKVLDVHPCLGKVSGRRLLDELGIAHMTRLADLTSTQVAALARRCGCDRG